LNIYHNEYLLVYNNSISLCIYRVGTIFNNFFM